MQKWIMRIMAVAMAVLMTACQWGGKKPQSTASVPDVSQAQSESASFVASSQEEKKPIEERPADVVKLALEAIKAQDFKAVGQHIEGIENIPFVSTGKLEGNVQKAIALATEKLDYRLEEALISGDTATLKAKIINRDYSACAKNMQMYAFTLLAKSTQVGQEELMEDFAGKLSEELGRTEDTIVEKETTFTLVRIDGKWKLRLDTESASAVFGGVLDGAQDMISLFAANASVSAK